MKGDFRRDYLQRVAEAKKAVAAVQDPELKRVAFVKILNILLGRRKGKKPIKVEDQ